MHSPEIDADRIATMQSVVAELEADEERPSLKRAPKRRLQVGRPAFHSVVRYDAMPGTDPKAPPKFDQAVASTEIRPGAQIQASDRGYRGAEDGSLRRLLPRSARSKKARRLARRAASHA